MTISPNVASLGYGVIMQIKVNNDQGITGVPDQPKRPSLTSVVSETSVMGSNNSLHGPSTSVSNVSENIMSEAPKTTNSQSEISHQTLLQEVKPNEIEKRPASINIIPYEGEQIIMPFKQEKESNTLPVLKPDNLKITPIGEKVLIDIASQKGNQNFTSAKDTSGFAELHKNGTTLENTPELSLNETINPNSDIYVQVAFDIFMAWNPQMTDPSFPPRLNVIQLLNEAVSGHF